MALSRATACPICKYEGKPKLSWVGIAWWVIAGILVLFSFMFWPLFLVWPVFVLLLLLIPVGHHCPECGSPMVPKS